MPDISSQQQSLNRRRQLAAALQQQSMMPLEQPGLPGANMNVTQGLARVAQALVAALSNRKLDKEQGALDTSQQAERLKIAQAMIPRQTGIQQVMPDPTGGSQTFEQLPGPQDQNRYGAMAKAIASGDPYSQQLGQFDLQQLMRQQEQGRGEAADQAKLIQQQQGQQALQATNLNAEEMRQQAQQAFQASQNALYQTPAGEKPLQSEPPGSMIRDPKTNEWVQVGTPSGASGRFPTATVTKVGPDGKPMLFRQNPQTGAYDIPEGQEYIRPNATPAGIQLIQAGIPEGMNAELSDALQRATFRQSPTQRGAIVNTVEQQVKRGDIPAARSTIKQAAVDGESAAVRAQVMGRRELAGNLAEIDTLLKKVPQNLLVGTLEDTARKLGTTSNQDLVKVGARLLALNQSYRKAITGAQFSQQESAEYQKLLPGYSNTSTVNQELISGLMDSVTTTDRVYWDNKLGPGWTDLGKPAEQKAGIAVKPGGALEALIKSRQGNAPR